MKKIITFGLTASALLIATTPVQAATMLIDNFNNESIELEVNTLDTTNTASQTNVSGVLGGTRDISLEFDDNSIAVGNSTVNIDLFSLTNDDYRHNNDSEINSTATIKYNGFGVTDLSAYGRFVLDVVSFEETVLSSIGVSVIDSSENESSVETFTLTPSPISFNFADFTGIDFSNIMEINLQTKGINGEDLGIDNFRATSSIAAIPAPTPEPAAIFGLLFSLGCGALFRKKK